MRRWIIVLFLLIQFSILSQTKEEIYQEFKNQEIHHEDIVYAQIILETGNLTSKSYKKSNNLLGLMKNRRLKHYQHWSESIADYKKLIQSRYREGEDYYHFLKRIRYAKNPSYNNSLKRIVNEELRKKKKKSKTT